MWILNHVKKQQKKSSWLRIRDIFLLTYEQLYEAYDEPRIKFSSVYTELKHFHPHEVEKKPRLAN